MYDVAALGESLIDLTECGINELGIVLMARNPGGAPANCLAMNAKLGGKVAMLGMVGDDTFGRYLADNMARGGIDTKGLVFSKEYPTTLSIVSLDAEGEKSCSFYRNPSADMMYGWEQVDKSIIEECGIFHFGGVSLTGGPCAEATVEAAAYARAHGKTVSYDPNYRELLWNDPERAKKELLKAVPLCDILKVNEDELKLMCDTDDPIEGGKMLKAMGPAVVLVTLGGDGACYVNDVCCGRVEPFKVTVRDTTGAGDAFTGAFHYVVKGRTRDELANMTADELDAAVRFASAAGALTTTKIGAIPALPAREDIAALMK